MNCSQLIRFCRFRSATSDRFAIDDLLLRCSPFVFFTLTLYLIVKTVLPTERHPAADTPTDQYTCRGQQHICEQLLW